MVQYLNTFKLHLKKTDSKGDSLGVPEYEDFIGGIVAGFNYSFDEQCFLLRKQLFYFLAFIQIVHASSAEAELIAKST